VTNDDQDDSKSLAAEKAARFLDDNQFGSGVRHLGEVAPRWMEELFEREVAIEPTPDVRRSADSTAADHIPESSSELNRLVDNPPAQDEPLFLDDDEFWAGVRRLGEGTPLAVRKLFEREGLGIDFHTELERELFGGRWNLGNNAPPPADRISAFVAVPGPGSAGDPTRGGHAWTAGPPPVRRLSGTNPGFHAAATDTSRPTLTSAHA
jgi:hypothetical protein